VAQLLCGQALSQTDADIDTIVVAWNRHLSTLGCVKYVVEGAEFFPQDSIEPGFPPEDVTAPRKMTLWIDFAKNRIRKELMRHEAHVDEHVIRQTYTTQTFDGVTGWMDRPRQLNPEWYQSEGKYISNVIKAAQGEIGYYLDGSDRAILLAERVLHRWDPSNQAVTRPLPVGGIRVHGWGERSDGRFLIVRPSALSGRNVEEFWVDSEKDFSIVRYTTIKDGHELFRIDLFYDPAGDSYTLRQFQYLRRGRILVDIQVTSRETVTLPEADLFSITPSSGDYVRDNDTKERYVLQGGVKRDVRQVYLADQRRSRRRGSLFWGFGLGVVAVLIVYLRFGMRRKRV